MRRIILRRISIAGGATMKLNSDITGSCTAITAASPISDSRSRPIDVISEIEHLAGGGGAGIEPRHESELCRSAKKPTLCSSSCANILR